eukprot:7123473-Pyramimonas_sp.AAC.1
MRQPVPCNPRNCGRMGCAKHIADGSLGWLRDFPLCHGYCTALVAPRRPYLMECATRLTSRSPTS